MDKKIDRRRSEEEELIEFLFGILSFPKEAPFLPCVRAFAHKRRWRWEEILGRYGAWRSHAWRERERENPKPPPPPRRTPKKIPLLRLFLPPPEWRRASFFFFPFSLFLFVRGLRFRVEVQPPRVKVKRKGKSAYLLGCSVWPPKR